MEPYSKIPAMLDRQFTDLVELVVNDADWESDVPEPELVAALGSIYQIRQLANELGMVNFVGEIDDWLRMLSSECIVVRLLKNTYLEEVLYPEQAA